MPDLQDALDNVKDELANRLISSTDQIESLLQDDVYAPITAIYVSKYNPGLLKGDLKKLAYLGGQLGSVLMRRRLRKSVRVESLVASALLALHQGEYRKSVRWLKDAEKVNVAKKATEIRIWKSWAYIYLGKYAQASHAIARSAKVVEKASEKTAPWIKAEHHIVKGWYKWFVGDLRQAKEQFENALKYTDGYLAGRIDARLGLAHMQTILGCRDKALELLESICDELDCRNAQQGLWNPTAWIHFCLTLGWLLHAYSMQALEKERVDGIRARIASVVRDNSPENPPEELKGEYEAELAWEAFGIAQQLAEAHDHFIGRVDSAYGKGVILNSENVQKDASRYLEDSSKLATGNDAGELKYPYYYYRSQISRLFCLIDPRVIYSEKTREDPRTQLEKSLLLLRKIATGNDAERIPEECVRHKMSKELIPS